MTAKASVTASDPPASRTRSDRPPKVPVEVGVPERVPVAGSSAIQSGNAPPALDHDRAPTASDTVGVAAKAVFRRAARSPIRAETGPTTSTENGWLAPLAPSTSRATKAMPS